MRKLHLFLFGALLIGGLASCSTQSIDPGTDTSAVFASNQADIQSYATTKGLSGSTTASGLYYVLSAPGSSSVIPAYGQEIEFNYTLYVLSRNVSNTAVITDKKIDSLYTTTSVFFPFFAGSLIPALEEGFLKMHEGEKTILLAPSSLAYGNVASANGSIPANSPVRFDVTLKRSRTENQQIDEYLTANKLTPGEVTSSGLRFIKTVTNSAGATPGSTQSLVVKYSGRLLRALAPFDSTGATGTYITTIGKNVPGFDEGLAKLKVGEKATIIFPSASGYGAAGRANSSGVYIIPPYSPLRFDIELVSAQ